MSSILKSASSWVSVYASHAAALEQLAGQPSELLPLGITRLYELINSGEIDSQFVGSRRWINYQV
jgi:hypothetical protein